MHRGYLQAAGSLASRMHPVAQDVHEAEALDEWIRLPRTHAIEPCSSRTAGTTGLFVSLRPQAAGVQLLHVNIKNRTF